MNYNDIRRVSRTVRIGNRLIGGENPIAIQSMTNTVGYDNLYKQIKSLEEVGCDIVRMTVPDLESVDILKRLKASDINIPIVADIHFNASLAIAAAMAGADKIRLNPGNIGTADRIKSVADACRERDIPIRVGVNSGSLDKTKIDKYGSPTAQALAESALESIRLLEQFDFCNIVVAIKSSSPQKTLEANRLLSGMTDHPIHLGVTEGGSGNDGMIKAAAGIGGLLCMGIGDTIRVSLTDKPEKEIECGISILKSLGFYSKPSFNVISCPTCGRTKIDLIPIVARVNEELRRITPKRDITVAVMGCVVNGPGEAKEADIGIAGGVREAVLFEKGVITGRIPEDDVVGVLIEKVKEIAL